MNREPAVLVHVVVTTQLGPFEDKPSWELFPVQLAVTSTIWHDNAALWKELSSELPAELKRNLWIRNDPENIRRKIIMVGELTYGHIEVARYFFLLL